jgi:polar amino acid transport system substrate-binding protein
MRCFGLYVTAFAYIFIGITASLRAETYTVASFSLKPMMTEQKDGSVGGIYTDLVREAFSRANHEVQFMHLPFPRALMMLKEKRIDAVASFFYAKERESFAVYARVPVLNYKMVFMARKESSVSFKGDYADLAPHSLVTLRGSSYTPEFFAGIRRHNIKTFSVNNFDQSAAMVLNKRVDLAAVEFFSGINSVRRLNAFDKIQFLEPPIAIIPTYLAFAKDRVPRKVVLAVEKALESMRDEDYAKKILKNYIPSRFLK